MLGCREHPFTKDGEKYLVEECVCKTNECNEKMQSITSSTTEGKYIIRYVYLSESK